MPCMSVIVNKVFHFHRDVKFRCFDLELQIPLYYWSLIQILEGNFSNPYPHWSGWFAAGGLFDCRHRGSAYIISCCRFFWLDKSFFLWRRDVVQLIGSHLDLYRRNQSAIGVELMATLSLDGRDERLKRHLFASKELHPALISSECEHKVWVGVLMPDIMLG